MFNSNSRLLERKSAKTFTLKRREFLPMTKNFVWKIESGSVRSLTWSEDGSIISLGFWGEGDVVGQPLTRVNPYQVECLSDVEVYRVEFDQCFDIKAVMLSHIHQAQEFVRIRNGNIHQRMINFLDWLAFKFGRTSPQGEVIIPLRLTHQEIAEVLGTTRVTVTRLLNQFQEEGMISCPERNYIVIL